MPPHYRGLPCGQRDDTTDFNIRCSWRQLDCNGKQRREHEQKKSDKMKNFEIIDYSEKSIAVIGDTKNIKESLKEIGGVFNPRLRCGAGWIFSKKKMAELEEILGDGVVTATTPERPQTDTAELIGEYRGELVKLWRTDTSMIDFCIKKISSIRKLSNGGLITWEKPQINTNFCFGYMGQSDEGDAQQMAQNAKKNEDYFLSENLGIFDVTIKKIKSTLKENNENKLYIYKEYSRDSVNLWGFTVLSFSEFIYQNERKIYNDIQEASDEDIKIILEAEKEERKKFEKRLKTYLKRYGLSKVKTWSYWQD